MNILNYLILLLVSFLMACGGAGDGPDSVAFECDNPTTENIEYMGYYWGMSHAYGNFADSISEYTNMVNIHIDGAWEANADMMEEAIEKGMAPLPYIDTRAIFLDSNWQRSPHPNMAVWDKFVETMTPYVDDIAGFYVFDEPYIYNIPVEDQEWIISYFNKAFPGVPTWSTFASYDSPIPSNLDIVSATPLYGKINGAQYNGYLKRLKANMYPHQRLAITMDAYNSTSYISVSTEEWKADMAQEYFEIAKCNPRVMALYIFVIMSWDDHLGVESMPILEAELQSIWNEINL